MLLNTQLYWYLIPPSCLKLKHCTRGNIHLIPISPHPLPQFTNCNYKPLVILPSLYTYTHAQSNSLPIHPSSINLPTWTPSVPSLLHLSITLSFCSPRNHTQDASCAHYLLLSPIIVLSWNFFTTYPSLLVLPPPHFSIIIPVFRFFSLVLLQRPPQLFFFPLYSL